jgi:hypothetical protein
MKYLKNYLLFLEADENIGTDDVKSVDVDTTSKSNTESTITNSLQDTKKLLDEYSVKKTTMENIFKDPKIMDDAALTDAIFTKIYLSKKENQNKLLKEYETVLRMERKKNEYKDKINKDKAEVKSTNDYIYQLNRELKEASAKRKPQILSSIKKNKEILKKLNDNIISNNKSLSQDTTIWKKAQEDFKKYIKTEDERIKNLVSKV